MIVADLDKARTSRQGKSLKGRTYLNYLIEFLDKHNFENTIFLSYPDIEYWIACSIGRPDLDEAGLRALGYIKGNTVNHFIKSNNGSYDLAQLTLKNSNKLYYEKRRPKDRYRLEPENILEKQSNLEYFVEYVKELMS